MNLRFKLVTTIATVCILATVLVVSVFAISEPQVSVSGNVSFAADQVYAKVLLYKANEPVTDKNNIVYVDTGSVISFDNTDTEDIEKTENIDLDKLTDTKNVTGYKIEIVDDSEDVMVGVKIASLILPQVEAGYSQFTTVKAYINSEEYIAGTTDLNSFTSNAGEKIIVEIIITVDTSNDIPESINDLFPDTLDGYLQCVLARVNY